METLLSPVDVARLLGVSENTLANWRSERQGPPFCKVGALVRYPADRLHQWIESRMRLPEPRTAPPEPQFQVARGTVRAPRAPDQKNWRFGRHKTQEDRRREHEAAKLKGPERT